ncbi:hypothetical protein CLI81_08990 [Porphyromonas gingivalis]|nr:hypothetical protein CLI81_08990 [Porphyromonas gingivalis]
MSTAKIQIIRYFFKHNAHVLWAFTTNQKTNSLVFSYVELTLIMKICKFLAIKIRKLADLSKVFAN